MTGATGRRGYVWECPVHGDTTRPIYLTSPEGSYRLCPEEDCDHEVPLVHSGLDDPENEEKKSTVWRKSPTAVTRKPKPKRRPAATPAAPMQVEPASLLLGDEPSPAIAPDPAPTPEPEVSVEAPESRQTAPVDIDLEQIEARQQRLTAARARPDPATLGTLETDLRTLVFEDVPRLVDRARRGCQRLHLLPWPDENPALAHAAPTPAGGSPAPQPGPGTARSRVLQAIEGEPGHTLRTKQVVERTGLEREDVDGALQELLEEGRIRRIRNHTWSLRNDR